MKPLLICMFCLCIIGGLSAAYLWRQCSGIIRHAFLSAELAFFIGAAYVCAVWFYDVSIHLLPIVLLGILAVIAIYLGAVAIHHFIDNIDRQGKRKAEEKYNNKIEALSKNGSRTT